jgi:hypothetical protein
MAEAFVQICYKNSLFNFVYTWAAPLQLLIKWNNKLIYKTNSLKKNIGMIEKQIVALRDIEPAETKR